MKIKQLLGLCAFMAASFPVLAQQDYVVLQSGDTLRGRIKRSTPATQSLRVTFVNGEGEGTAYKPNDLKGWGNDTENVHYESRAHRPKGAKVDYAVFMRRYGQNNSPVRHYQYWNTDMEMGYMQYYLVQPDGKQVEVPTNKKFYNFVADYFADYQELSEQVRNKQFKKTELPEIVAKYNTWKTQIR